jgi:hypothetical protein
MGTLLFSLAFSLQLTQARSSQNSPDELRNGAESFIKLIQSKETTAVLNRFSEQGTSFIGTAYVPSKALLSPEDIHKDFDAKVGVYCMFFDTKCFREEDAKERARSNGRALKGPLSSLVDLLAKSKEKRFVTYDISGTNGKVTLLLSARTPDAARLGEDAVNFYFRFENGQWKLRNIEYN